MTSARRSPSDRVVLITGFPSSFLARRVTQKILQEEPKTQIRCVVPEGSMQRAQEVGDAWPEAMASRVQLLRGETAAIDFGLAGPAYLALCREVNVIHHCAAVTFPGVDPDVANQMNVGGAIEALELAEATDNLERLVFWSSTLVSGNRRGRVGELELPKPVAFRNPIEKARFHAEQVVREAMDHVPVTVLRPSTIVGDSKTGEIDRFEGPYLLILLMLHSPVDLRVPLPGRGDVPLHLVPIDYVVDAGYAIATDARSVGRTFHLVDRNPLTARRIFELIAETTGRPGPVGSLPTQLATAVLRAPGLERFSQIPRSFLEQLATEVVYDDRNTQELLADTGITCPPVQSYIQVLVDYVKRQQRARREEAELRHAQAKAAEAELEDPLG